MKPEKQKNGTSKISNVIILYKKSVGKRKIVLVNLHW